MGRLRTRRIRIGQAATMLAAMLLVTKKICVVTACKHSRRPTNAGSLLCCMDWRRQEFLFPADAAFSPPAPTMPRLRWRGTAGRVEVGWRCDACCDVIRSAGEDLIPSRKWIGGEMD